MEQKSSILIYGSNLGAHRASFAHCKNGHKVVFLNPGSYIDEKTNQALEQLPFDFCWICGHMPQRLFKALGCLSDNYNAEITSITGKAGNFKVKFKKQDQVVNNFICTECDECIKVCPVLTGEKKAIRVIPHAGWENIYVIDWEACTRCGKCEEVCPTGAIKLTEDYELAVLKREDMILVFERKPREEGQSNT